MSERHPEHQYLDLLSHVLERGDERLDRTGVGTRSLFWAMVRFDLSEGRVPILTTKRVYWKTAVKEMLWFLTGGTNIQPLLCENVRIWTDCPLFQRSVDLLLGAAFNFVGATVLQLMLAQQARLTRGELVWMGGDVHLYLNHLEQAREQLRREPRAFPQMQLARRAASIDDYRIEDFEVTDY